MSKNLRLAPYNGNCGGKLQERKRERERERERQKGAGSREEKRIKKHCDAIGKSIRTLQRCANVVRNRDK